MEDAGSAARAARKAAYRAARAAETAALAGGGSGGGGGETSEGAFSCALAEAEKEAGNREYVSRRFTEAIECYTRALSLLPCTAPARLPALRGGGAAAAPAAGAGCASGGGSAAGDGDAAGAGEAPLPLPPSPPLLPPIPAPELLRCVCHSNRAAVNTSLERWGDVLADCDRALELNPGFAKALRRRAAALEKLHLLDEADADCRRLLGAEFEAQLQPRDAEQLRSDLARLEGLRKARDAKLAEDMLGKLKDMGNGLLKSALHTPRNSAGTNSRA
jgi:tetratricopeptide (TPR) repeat protein